MKNRGISPYRKVGIIITSCILVTLTACTSSHAPSPTPATPPPAGTGEPVTINISAENIAFDKVTITVPAGAGVTMIFNNKDRVPHNVAVYETKAAAKAIFIVEDKRDSLLEMANDVRRKLLGMELATGLGKLNLGNFNVSEVKHLAQRTLELIQDGTISYKLFKASKK